MMLKYLNQRRNHKRLREALHQARQVRNMRRDQLSRNVLTPLNEAIAEAQAMLKTRGTETQGVNEAIDKLIEAVRPASAKRCWPVFSENFEVLIVAIAVAMAFRAYFFQPFKIPTGSMQPTLYGIHSVDRAEPGLWDRMPLKPIKWLLSGSWHRRIVIRADGELRVVDQADRPGYTTLSAAGQIYHVPSDAVRYRQSLNLRMGDSGQARVRRGDVLWAGDVIAGDHVFVNRITWNFRKPKRGDIMVFSTDGIPDLQQGTHYIKRLVGLPGESLSINPPDLLVNGEPVTDIPSITRIARRERLADWAPAYRGFALVPDRPRNLKYATPLMHADDQLKMSDHEYAGFGDNTRDSLDSRYFGPIPERNLVGPAWLVYWPFRSHRWGTMR